MYEIAFWFCLMEMAKKKKQEPQNSNAYAYMHICTHVHTHKYTAYFIMPTWPVQIFGYKYIQEKVNGKKKKKKKQSPLRRIEVKRDLQKGQVERYRRLLTAQESIHFQNSWKGFKGVFRGVQFISFSTMTVSVELPWNIPQLYMINQPPHAIMFHSPNII